MWFRIGIHLGDITYRRNSSLLTRRSGGESANL